MAALKNAFLIRVTPDLHAAAIAFSKREQIPVAVLIRQMLKLKLGYKEPVVLGAPQDGERASA
jgi:hypothetical protein